MDSTEQLNSNSNTVGQKKIFRAMVRDAYFSFRRFMRRNCNSFANVMVAVCPFLFLWLGIDGMAKRGYFAIGGEWFLGLFWILTIWALKSYARHVNRADNMPVPVERFTRLETDGSYSMAQDRIYELVLFMGDYEDWLERIGHRF